ncbi:hypothetical protein BDF20DRAFT_862828 [Mycotypha africana]|uniref:uncharacterized protein n=1 Tax=Mycotypha africana TaxID=64632 RepID=UPI002300460B|nr:uncharacterized protein BDF20DRAFT_862828 [Mycotypha africana]KAI8981720.1 hypothetical protein BDF20DRAFT_862828 [Mycotypha africana]
MNEWMYFLTLLSPMSQKKPTQDCPMDVLEDPYLSLQLFANKQSKPPLFYFLFSTSYFPPRNVPPPLYFIIDILSMATTVLFNQQLQQPDLPYSMQPHDNLATTAASASSFLFDYFPLEICNRIADYLSNKQISECRTVCRAWHRLFTPSQYRHIHLRGRRQFVQFYQSVKMDIVGHYVRRLSVDNVSLTREELHSLPLLCPNVVEFSFNNKQTVVPALARPVTSSGYFDEEEEQEQQEQHPMDIDTNTTTNTFIEWKHLKRLTELNGLTVLNHLLQAPETVLSSLTHLSVSLKESNDNSNNSNNNSGSSSSRLKQEFFTALSKASRLIDLSLDAITLTLSEMEMIHTVCPLLQTLRITNVHLAPMDSSSSNEEKRSIIALNPSIQLAYTMRAFKYQNGGDLYMNYEWLYYIARKYPQLEELELWCEYSVDLVSDEYDAEDSVRQRELAERYAALTHIILSCGRTLTSLQLMHLPMNEWLFEAMDHMGTRLEHFSVGDMTDHTLNLLQHLAASKQNVSSLTVWGWPSLCLQDTMEETIRWIGRCSHRLQTLTFSMRFSGIKNFPMPVDLLLDVCPQLTSLTCEGVQVTANSADVSVMAFAREARRTASDAFLRPCLKTLVLKNGSFRNAFFTYLSLRCPRLNVLEITSCTLIDRVASDIKVNMDMPHHCFQRVSIDFLRPPSHYHHNSTPQDIRLFDVSVKEEREEDAPPRRRLLELVNYERYSPDLEFDYKQRTFELTRPIHYVDYTERGYLPPGFVIVINCQKLNELHIGNIWVS